MGAQLSPVGKTYVSRELAMRLDRFVARKLNRVAAAKALGVSVETIAAALEQGRLLTSTVTRLEEALGREGAT